MVALRNKNYDSYIINIVPEETSTWPKVMSGEMDMRAMQDDEVVVVRDDNGPQSAWPAWKHLLEDLAEARPPPSTLKLAYKNLGDAGVCRLAELLRGPLKNVAVLDLSCTSIGSAGASTLAAALEGAPSLRALDMSSNAVTDVGAVAFAKTLRGNTSLQSLSLHACLVGDKGATALAEALHQNVGLVELNLRQNYIGDSGAKALAGAIAAESSKLRVCDVQNNSYAVAGKVCLSKSYVLVSTSKSCPSYRKPFRKHRICSHSGAFT